MRDSDGLLTQYAAMHKEFEDSPPDARVAHFPGYSGLQFAWLIKILVRKYQCKTLLDYGCGLGLQYENLEVHKWWGVTPHLYDPAIPKFSRRPSGKYDGVICTDVMEHIAKRDVPHILEEIMGHAGKWAFFTICCRPAKRMLPDGRNCHVTLESEGWWKEQIAYKRPIGLHTDVRFTA